MKTKILTHILTSYDNKTFDTGRVLAFAYFLSTIVFQGWDLYHGYQFSAQDYLVGGGGFLAGLGVYLFGDKESPENKMKKEDGHHGTTTTAS